MELSVFYIFVRFLQFLIAVSIIGIAVVPNNVFGMVHPLIWFQALFVIMIFCFFFYCFAALISPPGMDPSTALIYVWLDLLFALGMVITSIFASIETSACYGSKSYYAHLDRWRMMWGVSINLCGRFIAVAVLG